MTGDERAEIIGEIASLGGKIEALKVAMDANRERTTDEIKALFEKATRSATKIEDIRVDYVPKNVCDEHHKQNREEHAAAQKENTEAISKLDARNTQEHMQIITCLDKVKWRVAMICGGVSLAAFLCGQMTHLFGAH